MKNNTQTGEQFEKLLTYLAWNINYIRDEAGKINTKKNIRDRVISLCDNYDKVLADNLWKDGSALFIVTKKTLEEFHAVISELENAADEASMRLLLMCHIADMLNVIEGSKDLIEGWKGVVPDLMTDEEFHKLLNKTKSMQGMILGECYDYFEKMEPIARSLVQEKITGERKGLPGEYNYMHSIRVYERVKGLHHWDDPDFELFLAALLHDIVEDGGVSFEELVALGFTGRTIELIRLCTHDVNVENKTERWTLMIAKLIEARDDEAWSIKLCDLADNLAQSHGLTEENRKFMVEVKAPLMLRLTENIGVYGTRYRYQLASAMEKLG